MSRLSRNRRTLLGAALATAGLATQRHEITGKHKKKKKCHAPNTRCGKKQCCQPGQTCVSGQCQAAATTSATTPTPLTALGCDGPFDTGISNFRRFAQPFVANGTGKIATASFLLLNVSDDTPYGVEIRTTQNGAPTDEVLGAAFVIDIPATNQNEQTRTAVATFHPTVAVMQGITYALVITDLAHKGLTLGQRTSTACAAGCYYDPGDSNTFAPSLFPLIFRISP